MRKKPTHGGARPGAGRPKTKGVTVQFKITPAQKEWLEETAAACGGTMTQFVIGTLVDHGMPE